MEKQTHIVLVCTHPESQRLIALLTEKLPSTINVLRNEHKEETFDLIKNSPDVWRPDVAISRDMLPEWQKIGRRKSTSRPNRILTNKRRK